MYRGKPLKECMGQNKSKGDKDMCEDIEDKNNKDINTAFRTLFDELLLVTALTYPFERKNQLIGRILNAIDKLEQRKDEDRNV